MSSNKLMRLTHVKFIVRFGTVCSFDLAIEIALTQSYFLNLLTNTITDG